MSKVIGIDLGTTNSVVSYMEGGQPAIITMQKVQTHTFCCGFYQRWRAFGWSIGKTSSCDQS